MPKTKISEFDVDPSNNTDINNINIAEGCAPSGINNAIRQLMSDLKEQQTGAGGDNFTVGGNLAVTGTTVHTGATTFTGAVVFSSAITATNATLDTPTINSPVIVYEGATANDFETTLAVTDPTADRTITFPDKTGTVAVTTDLPSNTSLTTGSGTYSIAGTTMTISDTSHGLTTGFQIYCNFTSGTAVDNYFTVTVTDANTFTLPYGSSLTTSGNVTWYYSPKGLVSLASADEAIAGTNTDRAVTSAGLSASLAATAFGVGQTWTDVSGSRVSGTTYTNSTGKPIQVMVQTENTSNSTYNSASAAKYSIGGVVVGQTYTNNNSNTSGMFQAVIPNGVTYSVSAATIRTWYELR
jgi:hypothetical protein